MAADWARGCLFQHGQPYRDVSTAPYNPVGQNLYAISGADLNVTRAVVEWYNEKVDFNFDTLGCTDGKMCGHYTQVSFRTWYHDTSWTVSSWFLYSPGCTLPISVVQELTAQEVSCSLRTCISIKTIVALGD